MEKLPLLPDRGSQRSVQGLTRKNFILLAISVVVVCLVLVNSRNNLKSTAELYQWVVPKTTNGNSVPLSQRMRYMYVQSGALHYDNMKKMKVVDVDDKASKFLAMGARVHSQTLISISPNQTTAPPGQIRNCAVSSLMMQASLVLHGWGICGYMLHPSSESTHDPVMGFVSNWTDGPDAIISGPPNNTFCTPKRMNQAPCNTEWVRTLARNDPSSFKKCLGKIKGVSETCNAYDKCGPRKSVPTGGFGGSGEATSVCNTADVSYYKEPEILAMCGICDMFRATMTSTFQSPRAGFLPDPAKSSAGRTLPAGLAVGVASLLMALQAAA